MTSRRLLKAAEAIREVVSMAILTEIRDPRVQNITVTGVEVAPDMREAKILLTVMGTESQEGLALRGLSSSAGFLQSRIAERIDTRYTPRVSFEIDEGLKKSMAVNEILQKIKDEQETASPTGADPTDNPVDALDANSTASDEASNNDGPSS
jgi:ribosome-binding factor A